MNKTASDDMRARNIKPGFFTNDLLLECDPLARLLFIGLWCMADKAGRLEDRPKKIKIDVLPCDDCDIEKLLHQLESNGFIIRYLASDRRYIQVVNFDKHQNPHCKEKASTIPAPCKHAANTVRAADPPEASTADSLIPDSLIPEPSLISDSGKASRKKPKVALSRLTLTAIPCEWAEWSHYTLGWEQDVIQDVWLNFRDYWISRPGKSAQKSDWAATWRNWCRQQKIHNGGKHAATFNASAQGARPSKSERFRHALVSSTIDELGAE